MNTPDDFDLDLRDRLSSAIGAEPPMESLPHDDLARGRRLDRRRRWTAVGAAATVVPALSLGAYALSGGFGGALGAGPSTVRMVPADGGESTEPADSQGTLTADCSVSPVPSGDSARLIAPPGRNSGGSRAKVSVGRSHNFDAASGRIDPSPSATGRSVEAGNGQVRSAVSGGRSSADCIAVDHGAPIDSPDVDRVTEALNRHVDPNNTHAGMTIVSGSVTNAEGGGKASGIYAGYEWTDGARTGMITVSVEDPAVGNSDSCADPSSVNGPDVTCETRTLDDGTTVLVGRGQQDGAERITVRYERADGTLVWATADEATEQWWTDQTGAAPLTSAPVTVDQLIDLVRDPDVRL
jgi:hypothetical protein